MIKKLVIFWALILFVYLLFAGNGTFSYRTSNRNYFSLQAYSWLKGHIDLVTYPQDKHDLSIYKNKVYLYWPPLPAVFALPFVVVFGLSTSDAFYSAFFASTVPILLYLVLVKAKKIKFIPNLPNSILILLTLFFAFGTVFFYLSVVGTVWFTSQVISMIPLVLSYYFLFKFVETAKQKHYLLSIILLCLSFWGRNTLIISGVMHLYILLFLSKKIKSSLAVLTFSLLAFNFLLFGLYNNYRFGSFTENGFKYHKIDPRWVEDLAKYGMVNIHYISHNFFYLFINPLVLKPEFPFFYPDVEGNSIFSTSPLFLLLFGVKMSLLKSRNRIFFVFLATSFLTFLILLIFLGTGWAQFGSRYALDTIPLLILALAWVINEFPKSFVTLLFLLSVFLNLFGILWWLQIFSYS